MSVGVSGNVPRLSISTILNDKLHLEYFREFLNFKDQRLITLHRGTVQNLEHDSCSVVLQTDKIVMLTSVALGLK